MHPSLSPAETAARTSNFEVLESQAAASSDARLRDFVENAPVALHWVGDGGVILWANQAELDLLGYSRDEYVGRHIADFHADPPVVADILSRLTGGETLHDHAARLRHRDGSIRHVQISSNALFENGKFAQTRCFTRDVTGHRLAEIALRENEWRLRYAMESAGLTFLEVDLNRSKARTAENFAAVMGYPSPFAQQADVAAGVQALLEHVVPDDRPRVDAALRQFTAGTPVGKIEYRVLGDDGSERWIESRWSVRVGDHGEAPNSFATNLDITERKLTEGALRETNAFNRSIIDSSPSCIKVLDLDGNLLSMDNGRALLGIEDIRPFLNKSWVDFWVGDDRLAARAAVEAAASGAAGGFVGFFRTLRGEPKWWDVSVSPIRDAAGAPVRLLSVSSDVTRRKWAETNRELLASVSGDLACLTSVEEMIHTVGAKLAAYLGLSRCAFVEIDEAAEQVVIAHEWRLRQDAPKLVGVHRLADFVGPEFIRRARSGEVIVVRDTAADSRTDSAHFAALEIASFLCVPLIRDGAWRFALCLYHSAPYDWRDDEIEVTRELAARIWTRLERLRAVAELAESEERYRTLFGSIDEGFCIIEKVGGEAAEPLDFRFIEANPAFEVQSGVRDVVGKTIRQAFPALSADWYATLDAVFTTGTPIRFERDLVPGEKVLELFAFRLEPESQRRVAILFNDITERKRADGALRLSEARFRALFDRGPIAMYSCDASGAIQNYNRVAITLWGQEPKPGVTDEQFRGAYKFYRPDGAPLALARTPMADVLGGRVAAARDEEVIIERPDGVRMTVIENIVPLHDVRGDLIGVINCFYDVTERNALQRQTQAQAQTLADLDRRKDEFLAMLSHELRNPLAPISSALHLLRLQKNDDPIQQRARSVIERQVGQLTHLVDDLLEVSRINTGRVRLRQERILIGGVVERAVESTQALVAQHRHELTLSLPPQPVWLNADAARLEQVVVNLLTNAAKYTDDGGHIALSVRHEADVAVLRVRDTGIGIASELLPHVFDLFRQAERSLDRSQGGLGIGLCVVQRLVELHGGTVSAESVLGQGSEFIVRLPALRTLTTLRPPQSGGEVVPPEKRCRVLVVDDNVDAAQVMSMVLEISGHDVRTAFDGPSGLQAAIDHRPDVALLDIGLPGLTGIEVAQQIRHEPALAKIVLVAMTGYGQESDRQRSRDAGFDHHLTKPANFVEVEKILADVSKALVRPAG